MASVVPAAHAATPNVLRIDDNAIIFEAGSRLLWKAEKSDILSALGPVIRLESPSKNMVRIRNVRLLDAVDCEVELAATDLGELQFALRIGGSPRLGARTVEAEKFRKSEPATWMATAALDAPTFRAIRRILREEQLVQYSTALIGIDEKLRIHLVDNSGMSYWPRPGRFRHLQLLPLPVDAEVEAVPLAIARDPIDAVLRFDAGVREGTRLEVFMPVSEGETTILAHHDRTYRSVAWRAGKHAYSRKLRLALKESSGVARGTFPGIFGTRVTWTHSDRPDATRGKVLTRLEWCLPPDPFAFHGRHGRLSLCGEAFYDEYVPPGVVAESANEQLIDFRACAYVLNYGVSLPKADFGRLDFDHLRCMFPLAGLGEARDGSFYQLSANWGTGKEAVALSLDSARLKVMRARDHLSVTYRFHDVMLRRASGPVRFEPGKDAALIAELPPQHIAERAFARQLPNLPGPVADLPPDQLKLLSSGTVPDREAVQAFIKKQAITPEFEQFSTRFRASVGAGKIKAAASAGTPESLVRTVDLKLPKDAAGQLDAIWIGPQYVRKNWARRAARELASVIAAEPGPGARGLPTLDAVPALYGQSVVAWDVLQRTARVHSKAGKLGTPEGRKAFAIESVTLILEAAGRLSDEQKILQDVYRSWRKRPGQNVDGLPDYFLTKEGLEELQKWLSLEVEKWPELKANPPPWLAFIGQVPVVGDDRKATIADEYWKEQIRQGTDDLPIDLPVYARLSGITRLVFKWPGKNIAYSADDLSKWEEFELQVARRARSFPVRDETLRKQFEDNEQKRIAAEQDMIGNALEARGITRGGSTAQRLIDIVRETEAAPSSLETAIEIPYRLILSPAETARFVTSPSVAPAATEPNPLWQARLTEPGSSTLRALWSPDYWARSAFPQEPTRPSEPLRGPWAPWQLKPGSEPLDRFRGSLDAFDRHQLVGLTSVFGLPVIPRRGPDQRTLHTTQLAPPKGFELDTNILHETQPNNGFPKISDKEDQALYHPQTLTGSVVGEKGDRALPLLSLTAAGGFLTVDTSFTPPASLRWESGRNLFNAFSVGRWQQQIVQGGDVTAQVEYVGFLMPTGHQATLVKLSERVNLLPTSGLVPTSYLVQRHFIRVAPEKRYNAAESPGMPFACRGWPASTITMRGSLRTPDLVDPTQDRPIQDGTPGTVQLGGRIDLKGATGLAFWPRTARSPDKNVQFTFSVDDGKDVVAMPMIFVDNQAAHDADTMKGLYDYYNGIVAKAAAGAKAPPVAETALRKVRHFGAHRRYAIARTPGDTTLETTEWLVRVDSRRGDPQGDGAFAPGNEPTAADFRMNSTLESRDQPPFYPRLELATVRLQTVSGLSQTPQPDSTFRYYPPYLEKGFTPMSAPQARVDLAGDTFFQVVGTGPDLDMAGNGDRAGGVGRPSQKIVGLARVSPVGNSVPREEKQKFGAIEGFGARFFDDKAKLLGLVSLNELISKAKLLLDDPEIRKLFGAPLLREQLMYQAGAAIVSGLRTFQTEAVQPLLAKIEKVRLVYGAAYEAVKRLDEAIARTLQVDRDLPDHVAEVVAATMQAKAELDAVMAAPLTQLTEASRILATEGPIELQAALKNLVWKSLGPIPAPLARVLAGFDVELLQPMVTDTEVRTRLVAIRSQLEGAFRDASASVLARPLPPDLATLQRSLEEAFKAELDKRRSEIDKVLAQSAADTVKKINDAVGTAIRIPPPASIQTTYALVHDVLIKGDVSKIGQLKAILDASSTASMDACNAAARLLDHLRRQVLPLGVTNTGCLVCGTQAPAAPESFCATAYLAVLKVKTLKLDKAEQFEHLSCQLAVQFETLASRVTQLGRQRETFCSFSGIRLWGLALAAREEFSSTLMEWIAAARDILNGLPDSWSDRAKRELGEITSQALAWAIDVIVPPETNLDLPDQTVIQLYRDLRIVRNRLMDTPSATTFLSQTEELKKKVEAFAQQIVDLARSQIAAALAPHKKDVAAIAPILATTLPALYERVTGLRNGLVGQVPTLRTQIGRGDAWDVEKDLYLETSTTQDAAIFKEELTALAKMRDPDDDKKFDALQAFAELVNEKGPAPIRLANQIRQRFGDRLRETAAAKIMELVDLRQEQAALQKQLKALLPTKRLLNYQFALPLQKIEIGGLIAFRPDTDATKAGALKMESNTTVDVADGRVSSVFGGRTNEFYIDIGQGGEFLSLKFGAFEFNGGTGSSTSFKAPLRNVTIGPKMAFLAALSAFMGAKDGGGQGGGGKPPTGPYVERRALGPGIVAGYRLGFPVFTIGAMGFANVFFDAHCELPFNADDSVVRLSLSSRQSPMTIFYGIYGGSAYFQIEGDRRGTRRVDVSLEFGGAQAIEYGPLKGIGRVMTGIMVSRSAGSGTLSALFTADFTGHIACFGIAACFSLSMTQGDGGVSGVATLTYSFSYGPAKVTFRVTVFKREKNVSGDKQQSFLDLPFRGRPVMFAQAGGGSASDAGGIAAGSMVTFAVSPRHDWGGSRDIYSKFANAVGRRKRG